MTSRSPPPSGAKGTVIAVCLSAEGGVPKHPQPQVSIGPFGVEGDYHAGEFRRSGRHAGEPNGRQVTIMSREALDAAGEALGVNIPAGGVGENILVRGLGDLGDLKAGQMLRFSSGVELEITGQNDPCSNLMVYHPQTPKQLYGRRGLLCVVRRTGTLKPGDAVTIAD